MINLQLYISQLVEDLEKAAKNPPTQAYIEPPPHLEEMPDVAELALVPYKTIEELTGIDAHSFPLMPDLTGDQTEMVNKAIFKIFESLHIELIDIPENITKEWLYDVLTTNWDEPVQYLPSSGFDLELCTGNWKTCPYGEYCDCGEEPDFTLDDLPENNNDDSPEDIEMPF